ncbi:MAG: PASTA domain-containing protein, partial [Planctomycetaceae bacterium]|nr:PASTA domain-containing protein [Planctomycetaceae bacterium]
TVRVDPVVDLAEEWTITGWFKGLVDSGWKTFTKGSTKDYQIKIKGDGTLGTFGTDRDIQFRPAVDGSGNAYNTNSIANGWHHVTAVGTGTTTTFYIDGQYAGTSDYKSTSDVYYIGGVTRFAEYIDDVRIYNRALNEDEIIIISKPPTGDNQPPELAPVNPVTIFEGETGTIAISASDPNNDTLVLTAASLPGFAQFADNANGTGTVSLAPGYSDAGAYIFSLTVTDGELSHTIDVNLGVSNTNRAPVITAGGPYTIEEASLLEVEITATDPDGDALTLTAESLNDELMNFDDNGDNTAALTFFPGMFHEGNYTVNVTASDGSLIDSAAINLTVTGRSHSPEITVGGPYEMNEGETLSIDISALDPEDDTLVFTSSTVPVFGQFADNGDGTANYSFSPGSFDAGSYSFVSSVSDGTSYDAKGFDLVVHNVNQAPVAVIEGSAEVVVHTGASFSGAGSSDTDGDPLTCSWNFGDQSTGETGPAPSHTFMSEGTYEVILTVTDGQGGSDTASMTVTVTPPPVMDLEPVSINTTGVNTDPGTLAISGTAAVEIINNGTTAVVENYSIILFEDTNKSGDYTEGTDTILGSAAAVPGPGAGATVTANVTVSGIVKFAGNLIYAWVDSGTIIEETDEENNITNNMAACEYKPPVGTFNPTIEWSWNSSTVLSSSIYTDCAPMVANLSDDNGDGVIDNNDTPDIIFSSYSNSYARGSIRAISGDGSGELFTITDYYSYSYASTPVGDIDGDGLPEIIAHQGDRRHLLAFENDGTFKWRSDILPSHYSFYDITLADIDEDGTPEILYASTVLNNEGKIKWTGKGSHGRGPSTVANLDLEGTPEIIAGNTAYRSDGTIYWQNTAAPNGFTAVGNFDDDPYPEIIIVSGNVCMLEHTGEIKWTITLQGGGYGGAPTIADYDNDGQPEIGVAGAKYYIVYEADGTQKWAKRIRDGSSHITGSSVFDFEGDGSAEVVYADERYLRIYRGSDGTELYRIAIGSHTAIEYPVIADIDNDNNAEIVVPGNRTRSGLTIIGDANDTWVNTRKIWNQYGYHITNVNDDATIPQKEQNSWQTFNSYRQNQMTNPFGCNDLTASHIEVDNSAAPDTVTVTARVGNGGGLHILPGANISFYNGNPASTGTLLGTVQTGKRLEPGDYEETAFQWNNPGQDVYTVYVVVDDDGTGNGSISEVNENNNTVYAYCNIGNTAPIANAGADTTVFVNETVTVNGSASSDPDGNTISYQWSFASQPDGSTASLSDPASETPSFTADLAGSYSIQLVVNDGSLDSVVDLVTITASPVITVPHVSGMTQEDAGAAITGAELAVGTAAESYSDTVPAGLVISQSPAAGTTAFRNSTVDIVLSLGVHMATVPSLTGLTSEEANAALSAEGFTLGSISQEYISTIPENNIMNQNPAAGTSVIYGSPVDVTVSAGKWDGVDETAPHVSISVTPEKVFIDEEVTITINAWDNAGIVDRHLTINGDPVDLTGDEYSFYPAEAGKYT